MNTTMDVKTIVGWDGSAESRAALAWAAKHAARTGTSLHILSVMVPFPFMAALSFSSDDFAEAVVRSLDDEVSNLQAGFPEVLVTSELVAGDVTEVFLQHSRPGTVLVFGTRHRSAPYFRFAWNFGRRLAASSLGPVVIVPVDSRAEGSGIVVGVDGSPESDAAVRFAAAEAHNSGQTLHLIHAWLGPIASPIPLLDVDKAPWLVEAHQKTLDAAVAAAREEWPDLRPDAAMVVDTAAHALLERSLESSLTVVGARGRGPLASLAFGSVSTALVASMSGPLAIIGPQAVETFSTSVETAAASR